MTRNEYNGWTNYETWLVKLWMDNEEAVHARFCHLAEEAVRVRKPARIDEFAGLIKQWHEDAIPDLSGFACDLMTSAMAEVDWEAIACSFLEDAKRNLDIE